MKFKHVIMTLGLAAVLGLGVGAGLKAGAVKEAKAEPNVVRKYLDCSGFEDYDTTAANSAAVHTWGDQGDQYTVATKASDNYWYADVDIAGQTGFQWLQCETANQTNRFNWLNNAASIDNNYVKVTGWSAGTYSTIDLANWKVTGHTGGTWGEEPADTNVAVTSVKFDNDGLQVYSVSVTLPANLVFKFTDGTNWYGFGKLSTYNGQSAREKGFVVTTDAEAEDPNIKVVTAGTYEVYIKPAYNTVWMQLNSQSEIVDFSTRFLAAMRADSVCGTTAETQKRDNKTAIDAIWGTWQDEFEDELTSGAKSKFLVSNEDANVSAAASLYLHIVARYGAGYEWEGGPAASNVTMAPISHNADNTMIIIAAASIISIVAVGAFFFIRKKKTAK